MDNFKFNFLSRGQLESLNLLTFIQNIIMLRGFFGNLIFAIIARMLCGNHLDVSMSTWTCNSKLLMLYFYLKTIRIIAVMQYFFYFP